MYDFKGVNNASQTGKHKETDSGPMISIFFSSPAVLQGIPGREGQYPFTLHIYSSHNSSFGEAPVPMDMCRAHMMTAAMRPAQQTVC